MRLIDADALRKEIRELPNENTDYFYLDLVDREVVQALISEAPTVEPPQGTWEEGVHFRGMERQLFCSKCKQEAEYNETHNYYFKSPFCPWCGAKMKAGDSDA